jgi:hypothetical protein
MKPLYRSRDGKCSLRDFHSAVNGKDKLLTIFQTEDDQILAAYLSVPYKNTDGRDYINDCDARIFSITKKTNYSPENCFACRFYDDLITS